MVTPLPPRPNTAVTLLVSSANAAASRSWCSGRTTENRDNVFMNNRWPYISWRPSAYAAGSAARRSAGPKPSGSCVTAQAPHACMGPTSRKRLRRATGQEAAVHPTPAKLTGAKTSWHRLGPVPPCRLSAVPLADPATGTRGGCADLAQTWFLCSADRSLTEQRRTPITAGCVRCGGLAGRLVSLSVGRALDAFGEVALVNSGEDEHSRDGTALCSEHASQ